MVKVSVKAFKDAVSQSLTSKTFSDVLLKTCGSVLEVKSVDYDSYLSISINADIEKDLTALVDKKQLLNIIKTVKLDTISFSKHDNDLVISTDKATYKLKSKDPSIFNPLGLDKNTEDCIYLNFKKVITLPVDRVMYAVSKKESNN